MLVRWNVRDVVGHLRLATSATPREHYEIAGYQKCIAMARTLGEREIVSLFNQSLSEEVAEAKRISMVGKSIMKTAAKSPNEKKRQSQARKNIKEEEQRR